MIAVLALALTVTTSNAQAQADFRRGLNLYYAYDRAGASLAFAQALQRDPHFAMAAWGEGLAVASDLNHPITPETFAAAHAATQHALALESYVSPRERQYIDALALRYSGSWNDYPQNERRYADAMQRLAQDDTDDDAPVLIAEALLEDRTADDSVNSQNALTLVTRVLQRDPKNVMANHLCIHAYDGLADRAPVKPCADRLMALALTPSEEHLAHMPAHAYMELGDYAEALAASERAWRLRERWNAQVTRPYELEYDVHDASVGYSAAMMLTDDGAAQRWGARLGQMVGNSLRATTLARFERWKEILAMGESAKSTPFALGMAYAHTGNRKAAQQELDVLVQSHRSDDLANILDAVIFESAGRIDAAAAACRRAIALQKQMYEAEYIPLFPAAEMLGAMYVRAGDLVRGREALHAALAAFPNDPRAIAELALACGGSPVSNCAAPSAKY